MRIIQVRSFTVITFCLNYEVICRIVSLICEYQTQVAKLLVIMMSTGEYDRIVCEMYVTKIMK